MGIINIVNFQNIVCDINSQIQFDGLINGKIEILQNGIVVCSTEDYHNQAVFVQFAKIPYMSPISARINGDNPYINGRIRINSNYQNQLITKEQLQQQYGDNFSIIQIQRRDGNGNSVMVINQSYDDFNQYRMLDNYTYAVSLLCGEDGGGGPNSGCELCDPLPLNTYAENEIISIGQIVQDNQEIFGDKTNDDGSITQSSYDRIEIIDISGDVVGVYRISQSDQITVPSGQAYTIHATCCQPKTVVDIPVDQVNEVDLSAYIDSAAKYGVEDGTPWRLIETGYGWLYAHGTVSGGSFVGLPPLLKLVSYAYMGHMQLQVGCETDDSQIGELPDDCNHNGIIWPTPTPVIECETSFSETFSSGQSVDLTRFTNGVEGLQFYEGSSWSLWDCTHSETVLSGVYANGQMIEIDGTPTNVIAQRPLRSTYESPYSGTTKYRFVAACDNIAHDEKAYLVGLCPKKASNIPGSDPDYFKGDLNTIYTVGECALYAPNEYYEDKRMVLLAGPFDDKDEAETYKNQHNLLSTLQQQCEDRATIDFYWDGGCDLDINVNVNGETYGWCTDHDGSEGSYGIHYGDTRGCAGHERVAIKKEELQTDGLKQLTVQMSARWHHEGNNKIVTIEVSNGSKVIRKTVTVSSENAGDAYYAGDDDLSSCDPNTFPYSSCGSVTFDFENDDVYFSDGRSNANNTLLSMLPGDLQ